jgi:hypothetical protein
MTDLLKIDTFSRRASELRPLFGLGRASPSADGVEYEEDGLPEGCPEGVHRHCTEFARYPARIAKNGRRV